MIKRRSFILILFFLPASIFAQKGVVKQYWHTDWRIGTMGGMSYFATEMKKDFSKATMDMNPNLTGAFSMNLNKKLTNNLEAGIEFEKNFFNLERTYPDKINWLVYDNRFNNENSHFVSAPIYAHTNTSSWFINLNYNFLNFISKKDKLPVNLNMYVKGGIGFSSIGVDMGYIDPLNYEKSNFTNPIYEKGQGIHSLKDMYASFHAGTGINYYLSPRISINGEFIFLFVSNDYLDGIQNYEATKMPNGSTSLNRVEVFGIIGELKVGISYHFNMYKRLLSNGLWEQKYEEYTNEFYQKKKVIVEKSEEIKE